MTLCETKCNMVVFTNLGIINQTIMCKFMKFVELENLCKANPVSATWVQTNRLSIGEALEDYKAWGNAPEEEQNTLHDMVWELSQTWSYEMIGELMPHLSVENQTTELVRMIEAVGGENEIEYNEYCDLSLCEPFFKKYAPNLPIQNQIEVLKSLINNEYSPQCLPTAVRLCEITVNAIDWKGYEEERENDNQLYWGLPAEMVLATENRTHYSIFFEMINNAHPKAAFSALHYVVAMQVQGGYSPSSDRIELFNQRLIPYLTSDFEQDLSNVYSTINTQLRRQSRPPLQVPPRILSCMLYKNVEEIAETSAIRSKKM